jgi:hypothetical protein
MNVPAREDDPIIHDRFLWSKLLQIAILRNADTRQRFSITCNSWRNLTMVPCGSTPRKFTLG